MFKIQNICHVRRRKHVSLLNEIVSLLSKINAREEIDNYLTSAHKKEVVQHQLFVQTENVNRKSMVKFLFANHSTCNNICAKEE